MNFKFVALALCIGILAITGTAAATQMSGRSVSVRNGDVIHINGDKLRCVVNTGVIVCGLPPGQGGVWAYISRKGVTVSRAKSTTALVACLHRPQFCQLGR